MAQYRKSFYGSALYGKTTSFTSEYLSATFDAGETFNGQIRVGVTASTPSVSYVPGEAEVIGGETNMTVGEKASLTVSAKDVTVVFQGQTSGAFRSNTYIIDTNGDWVLESTEDVDMTGSGEMFAVYDALTYEERKIEVEVLSGNMQLIRFVATVTDYSVEIGTTASLDNDMEWELLPFDGEGFQEVYSSEKTDVRYVRFRITLASSDDGAAPEIGKVELLNGNAGTRNKDGHWLMKVNMESLAQASGKTFSKFLQLDWQETKPEGTELDIRSKGASMAGSTNYGPETARYRKGYRRISLERNTTEGFAYLRNPIDIKTLVGQNNQNLQWRNMWDVKSLPTNVSGQSIQYEFYDQAPTGTARPIAVVAGNHLSRVTVPAVLNQRGPGRPFYVGVRLKKRLAEATPVIDWLSFDTDIEYKERVPYQEDISGIDNGDGRKMLSVMDENDFGWPTNTNGNTRNAVQLGNQRHLRLIDNTGNSGVRLFFLSKENDIDGLTTSNLNDQVWGHAKAVEPSGAVGPVDPNPLYLHYHYNGGSVQYPHTDTQEMGSDFTPSLSEGRRYRYQILNGWPDREERIVSPMTWAEAAEMMGTDESTLRSVNPGKMEYQGKLLIGQWLKEPNLSVNANAQVQFSEGEYTESSIHNGNGNAVIEGRLVDAEYGVTKWVSEEKVYDGYINLNDVRGRFQRTQRDVFLTREEVLHILTEGETYEDIVISYGVNVKDLVRLNSEKELVVGDTLRIPSRLALPRLAPEVLFLDEEGNWVENPYKVEIVPNSIRRKDGTRMSDSTVFLEKDGIVVSRSEAPSTSIILTRGEELNGKEALGHSHVLDILSVIDEDGVSYTKVTGGLGDYRLDGNYISWSSTGQSTKEPAAGKTYTVIYTYEQVDELTVSFDSDYRQRAGFDVLWRSEKMIVLNGTVTPESDTLMVLPAPSDFEDWSEDVRMTDYVVEDNDLWVKTSIEERNGEKVLVASMEGRDPRRNWHPEMNTGFYYLEDKEFYLYSEPIEKTYGRESIPTASNIRYEEGRIVLSDDTSNLLSDGRLEEKTWRRKSFQSIDGESFQYL